jgi:virginiamycin A acetyltransferase
MKQILKQLLVLVARLLTLPLAALAGFGRFASGFQFAGHLLAQFPGLPGDYLRGAYYAWTLERFGPNSRIQFGSFFAHAQASVGTGVYIGSYCILGRTEIGDNTQIASGVQILSGRRQHARSEDGRIQGAETGDFVRVHIANDCWIGAGAIVMADVGSGTTVGAGAVVVKPLPANCVAVGNPARLLGEGP